MANRKTLWILLLAVALIAFAPACKKKQPPVTPQPPPQEEEAPPPPPPPPKEEVTDFQEEKPVARDMDIVQAASELTNKLQTVYFEFDSFDLSDAARATLQANATLIKKNPGYNVVVEGHCDERGTIEYNLALGEKRARAVMDYLASLGVAPSRLRIVSYGEERPVDPASNEAAWAKNRRAQFVAEQ